MKYLIFITVVILISGQLKAQEINEILMQGNEYYKKADYKAASGVYEKSLELDKNNITGRFNLANAQYKQNQFDNAASNYLTILKNTTDPSILVKTWYNLGNNYIQQKKIQDAINAYRQSLLLNPTDNDARENLQKAINEKQQQQNNNNKPNTPPNPKKSKNKLNQSLAEQYMQQLRDQEKQLQKQLQKMPPEGQKGKDW